MYSFRVSPLTHTKTHTHTHTHPHTHTPPQWVIEFWEESVDFMFTLRTALYTCSWPAGPWQCSHYVSQSVVSTSTSVTFHNIWKLSDLNLLERCSSRMLFWDVTLCLWVYCCRLFIES
jgi:hypothetical protein